MSNGFPDEEIIRGKHIDDFKEVQPKPKERLTAGARVKELIAFLVGFL